MKRFFLLFVFLSAQLRTKTIRAANHHRNDP